MCKLRESFRASVLRSQRINNLYGLLISYSLQNIDKILRVTSLSLSLSLSLSFSLSLEKFWEVGD